MPEQLLYMIYKDRNDRGFILQYVKNIDDNYTLEEIASDIPLDAIERYIRLLTHSNDFQLEGYKKAEGIDNVPE